MRLQQLVLLARFLTPRERKKIFFLLAATILSGAVFWGHLFVRATVSVPTVGGSYREGMLREPRTISPIYDAANDTDRDLARLVFSSLVTYDGTGGIVYDLAEKIDVSPDEKTYTVSLRKNAYWHDGKKVTAEDVLFTVKAIQNPAYKSPRIANWQGVQAEKVDEYTVQFVLRAPYAPFTETLTVGILPEHLWKNVNPEQAILHELNLKPIGSGPYQFDRFAQRANGTIAEYRLVRNPSYYREGPYLKTLTFFFYESSEMLLADWRRGRIDGFAAISKSTTAELPRGRVEIISMETPRVYGIFVNGKKHPALAEKRVREALSRAVSRDDITAYLFGEAAPLTSLFPPQFYFGTGTGSPIFPGFDPKRSRELLRDAGYRDADGDGILEKMEQKREGQKMITSTTTLSFVLRTSDSPDLLRAAEIIQHDLAAVGIDVDVRSTPLAELIASVLRPRDFELLLFGQAYGHEPDPFLFWHSSQSRDPGLNIIQVSDGTADRLLEEIRARRDHEERGKRLRELDLRLGMESFVVPLFIEEYLYVLPSGMKTPPLEFIALPSDRFNEVHRWYTDTKRVFKNKLLGRW